jgi:hypothetical protein
MTGAQDTFPWMSVISSLLAGSLGGLGTVYGLSKWLGNLIIERRKVDYAKELEGVKADYAKELEQLKDALEQEQNKIKAQLERSVFVTRAHFETEFQAMKDIFKLLSEANVRIHDTRPSSEGEYVHLTKGEVLGLVEEKRSQLVDSCKSLVAAVDSLYPFLVPEIYEALHRCIKTMKSEIWEIDNTRSQALSQDWRDQAHKHKVEFRIGFHIVARLMRKRIQMLTVIPGSH